MSEIRIFDILADIVRVIIAFVLIVGMSEYAVLETGFYLIKSNFHKDL